MSDRISNVSERYSTDSVSGSGSDIDNKEVRDSGKVNENSALKGEVHKVSHGSKARSFFYHPATIVLGTILTGPLYAIGLGIHALVHKLNAPSAIASMDPNSNEMPKIRNSKDLMAFLMKKADYPKVSHGQVVDCGNSTNDVGQECKLKEFKGLVFRADNRYPKVIKNQFGGFTSKNDLSQESNLKEAQGIQKNIGYGASGQSGASCSKNILECMPYCYYNPENDIEDRRNYGYIYIIDTTKLDSNEHAYDFDEICKENNFKNEKNEVIKTGSEVNITKAPWKAVVGWIETWKNAEPGDDQEDLKQTLKFNLSRNKEYSMKVTFNSAYKA